MDPSLDIYADLILHPAFPQKEFLRLQKERIAGIQREKVTPQPMALRVVPTLLYGKDHPYAVPFTGTGTEAAVSKMTREDLAKFHETWFKPNNSTLLVVGDTTLAEIKPKLEKLLASWKPGDVPKRTVPKVAEPAKDVVYLIDRPGSGQSVIFGAQLAPPQNDPDAIALQLVNGHLWRQLQLAHQHEPARGQALVVRRAGCAAGGSRAASLYQHLGGADRQDQGIDGRAGQGIQEHRGRKTNYRGRTQGRTEQYDARAAGNV